MATSDEKRCKEQIRGKGYFPHYTQCKRSIWKDGYCKQHHPETIDERREKRDVQWKLESDLRRKEAAIKSSAPALLSAAENLIADVHRRYPGEGLKCPYMIALDEAVRKAYA